MARITGSTQTKNIVIDSFYGMNENPDGETNLRLGEAAEVVNWRVTADGHLQKRPGYASVLDLGAKIVGMWYGDCGGTNIWLVSSGGKLYKVNPSTYAATELGAIGTGSFNAFDFGGKVYIQDGEEYRSYDGYTYQTVAGYRPVTYYDVPPSGDTTGKALQGVNKLNGLREVWFTPDAGATAIYHLPETNISAVSAVYVNGELQTLTADYAVDLTNGTVTFTSAPTGTTPNAVSVEYAVSASDRDTITGQKLHAFFNGETDNRVFLYGDGTRFAYYSDIEYVSGLPSAEYFPDLNVFNADQSNTPIMAMARRNNTMLAFKPDCTCQTVHGYVTDARNVLVAGFSTSTIHNTVGHVTCGQVRFVENHPRTLYGGAVYEWTPTYKYQNENWANRISARVETTLGGFDLSSAVTFDDEYNHEYWVCQGGKALIHNYGNNPVSDRQKRGTWYVYDNISATCLVQIDGEVYFGDGEGNINRMSATYRGDNDEAIDCLWGGGAMDFGTNALTKTLRDWNFTVKTEGDCVFDFYARSDRDEPDVVSVNVVSANFAHADFSNFTFSANSRPRTIRKTNKVKKASYIQPYITLDSAVHTATICKIEIPVSYGGKVRRNA